MRVKWPQDGALGAGRRLGVVDVVDQQGEAQDVGEEDEFLGTENELGPGEEGIYLARRGRSGQLVIATYVSDVATDLSALDQER